LKLLLIDESKAKKYLLCVVELDQNAAPKSRLIVKSARLKRQNTIHFVSESTKRKKEILNVFANVEFRCVNYLVAGLKEKQAREMCLRAMLADLDPGQTYSLIFDRDDNHFANDRRVIRSEVDSLGMLKSVEYFHREPSDEALLWLPDAIAWASARGGEWKRLIAGFAVHNKRMN